MGIRALFLSSLYFLLMEYSTLKTYAAAVLDSFPVLTPCPVQSTDSPGWQAAFDAFALFHSQLVKGIVPKKAARSIFARKGNVKLPFLSFSTLPFSDCPGKGACATFCYSVKGWRNVAPFFRQLRNSLLIRHARHAITQELDRILALPRVRAQESVPFRLYVDGDFYSADCVAFWQGVIAERPKLAAYGYSKSWKELLTFSDSGGKFATNYVLNLSSGSKWENFGDLRARMASLPCTRGEFLALSIKKRHGEEYRAASYREKAKNAAYAAGISRYFICPGQCGSCTPKGHYCGSKSASPVVILTH
jgi:hypothetical protein